jgi:hypothetical protein
VLDAIDIDALRTAAAHAPEHTQAFEALIDVIEGRTSWDAAWARIGDPARLIDTLQPQLAQAQGRLTQLKHQLALARRRLRQGEQHRQKMRTALVDLAVEANDAPALIERLQTVGTLLIDDDPWTSAQRAIDAAEPLIAALDATLRDPIPGAQQGNWAQQQAALEAAQSAIEAVPARLLQVRAVLVETAELAAKMQHRLAAALRALSAQLTESLAPEEADVAWRAALDQALALADLRWARLAARQVQARAMARGDHRLTALVAHRVAQLARTQNAMDVEILARLEQALAAARDPAHQQSARAIAADAVVGAEHLGQPVVLARARLMYAQLLIHLDDPEPAQAQLRKAMRAAKAGTVPPELVGRIALTLGQSEHAMGHTARARLSLQLALRIAQSEKDVRLFERALPATLRALDAVDPAQAAAVYRSAQASFPTDLDAALSAHFDAETIARWAQDTSA